MSSWRKLQRKFSFFSKKQQPIRKHRTVLQLESLEERWVPAQSFALNPASVTGTLSAAFPTTTIQDNDGGQTVTAISLYNANNSSLPANLQGVVSNFTQDPLHIQDKATLTLEDFSQTSGDIGIFSGTLGLEDTVGGVTTNDQGSAALTITNNATVFNNAGSLVNGQATVQATQGSTFGEDLQFTDNLGYSSTPPNYTPVFTVSYTGTLPMVTVDGETVPLFATVTNFDGASIFDLNLSTTNPDTLDSGTITSAPGYYPVTFTLTDTANGMSFTDSFAIQVGSPSSGNPLAFNYDGKDSTGTYGLGVMTGSAVASTTTLGSGDTVSTIYGTAGHDFIAAIPIYDPAGFSPTATVGGGWVTPENSLGQNLSSDLNLNLKTPNAWDVQVMKLDNTGDWLLGIRSEGVVSLPNGSSIDNTDTVTLTDLNGVSYSDFYRVIITPQVSLPTNALADAEMYVDGSSYSGYVNTGIYNLTLTGGGEAYQSLQAEATSVGSTGFVQGDLTVSATPGDSVADDGSLNGAIAINLPADALTGTGTISFAVSGIDQAGYAFGPTTYTITVDKPLTINAQTGFNNGLDIPTTFYGDAGTPLDGPGANLVRDVTLTGGSSNAVLTVTQFNQNTSMGLSTSSLTGTGTPITTYSLTGTPTATGTATFTVTAEDVFATVTYTTTATYTIVSNAPLSTVEESLTGTPTASSITGTPTNTLASPYVLPTAQTGAAYSQELYVLGGTNSSANGGSSTSANGSGAPYTVLVTNFTPTDGITVDVKAWDSAAEAGTVLISGTPTTATTLTFSVTVTDGVNASYTSYYSMSVLAAPVFNPSSTSPITLPSASSGQSYSYTPTVINGTGALSFSESGVLPPGITGFSTTTGKISGTATSEEQAETFTFTLTAIDTVGTYQLTTSQTYVLTVNAPVQITTTSLPGLSLGVPYSASSPATIQVSYGTAPYTFAAITGPGQTGLPAGLSINSSTGVISGSTSNSALLATGISFTVKVTDANGVVATQTETISVNSALAFSQTGALPGWTADWAGDDGVGYDETIGVTGGSAPYNFTITGLPADLMQVTDENTTPPTATGEIEGTPSDGDVGTSILQVTVTDAAGDTLSGSFTLTISPAVNILTTTVSSWTQNQSGYSQTIVATGGTPSLTYTWLNAPAGLGLNSSTGVISGTPTVAGTYFPTFIVTDSVGASATYQLASTAPLVIGEPLSTGFLNTSPGENYLLGVAGQVYHQVINVSNGTTPYQQFSATGTFYDANGNPIGTPGLTITATAETDQENIIISGIPQNIGALTYGTLSDGVTDAYFGTLTVTINAVDASGATLSPNTVQLLFVPGVVSQLQFSPLVDTTGSTTIRAGDVLQFSVSAYDRYGNLAANNTDGFNFTLGAQDSFAQFDTVSEFSTQPPTTSFAFTGADGDAGQQMFFAVLGKAGAQSISAQDITTNAIATTSLTVYSATQAASFQVTPVSGYTGTVASGTGYSVGDTLEIEGGEGTPEDLTVTAVNNVGAVTAVAATGGNPGDYTTAPANPVQVIDLYNPSASGATFNLTLNAGEVIKAVPTTSYSYTLGTVLGLQVSAVDAYGNVVTDTGSGTGYDNALRVSLGTLAGTDTTLAQFSADSATTYNANDIMVLADGIPAALASSGLEPVWNGAGVTTIYALLSNPVAAQAITFTDWDNATITGNFSPFATVTGSTIKLLLLPLPATNNTITVTAPTAQQSTQTGFYNFTYTLRASDVFGNNLSSYKNTNVKIYLTNSNGVDTTAKLYNSNGTALSGSAAGGFLATFNSTATYTFYAKLTKAGGDTISALDNAGNTGTSPTINVVGNTATQLAFISKPAVENVNSLGIPTGGSTTITPNYNVTAGSDVVFTLAAEDTYGNLTTSYGNLVNLSLSSLDANTTFYSSDPGSFDSNVAAPLTASGLGVYSYSFANNGSGMVTLWFNPGKVTTLGAPVTINAKDSGPPVLTVSSYAFNVVPDSTVASFKVAVNNVVAPAKTTASVGVPVPVVVTALDPYGNAVAPASTKNVAISVVDTSDATAQFSTSATLTGTASGHFANTLTAFTMNGTAAAYTLYAIFTLPVPNANEPGATQAVSVTDTTPATTVTPGQSGPITVAAGVASQLVYTVEPTPADGSLPTTDAYNVPNFTAGTTFTFTVTAEDVWGNATTNYGKFVTLSLSSNDPSKFYANSALTTAVNGYTFGANDGGSHQFYAVLTKANSDLYVNVADGTLSKKSSLFNIVATSTVSSLAVGLPAGTTTTAGGWLEFTVNPKDVYGNTVNQAYTNQIAFSFSDLGETGAEFALDNAGANVIEAQAAATATIAAGSVNSFVNVTYAGVYTLLDSQIPVTFSSPTTVGGKVATGYATTDINGNVVSVTVTYGGSGYTTAPTVNISSGYTFGDDVNNITNGVLTLYASMTHVSNSQTIAVTDLGIPTGTYAGLTATSPTFKVLPGGVASAAFLTTPPSTTMQNGAQSFQFSLTLTDAFGNLVPNATATVSFTPQATAQNPNPTGTFTPPAGFSFTATSGSSTTTLVNGLSSYGVVNFNVGKGWNASSSGHYQINVTSVSPENSAVFVAPTPQAFAVAQVQNKLVITNGPALTEAAGSSYTLTVQVEDKNSTAVSTPNPDQVVLSGIPTSVAVTATNPLTGLPVSLKYVNTPANPTYLNSTDSNVNYVIYALANAGEAVFNLTPSLPGAFTIYASSPGSGLTPSTGTAVTVNPGAPYSATFATAGNVTLTGSVDWTDGSKNVTGTGTSFKTQLQVGSQLFDPSGTLIGNVATIAANGLSLTLATATTDATGAAPGCFTVSATAYPSDTNGFSETVTVKDKAGNLVSGAPVTITSTPTGVALTGGVTNANGQYTWSDQLVSQTGSYALTANSTSAPGNGNLSGTGSLVVLSGAVDHLAVNISADSPAVVTMTATGGTWSLGVQVNGGATQTLTGLAWDIDPTDLQTALQALSNVGSSGVTVTGTAGSSYAIAPVGPLANAVFTLTANSSALTAGTATVQQAVTQGIDDPIASFALVTAGNVLAFTVSADDSLGEVVTNPIPGYNKPVTFTLGSTSTNVTFSTSPATTTLANGKTVFTSPLTTNNFTFSQATTGSSATKTFYAILGTASSYGDVSAATLDEWITVADGSALAGTITSSTSVTAVTGTSTHFLTQAPAGSNLYDLSGKLIGTVLSVTNDTDLTLVADGAVADTNATYTASYVSPSFDVVPGAATKLAVGSLADLTDNVAGTGQGYVIGDQLTVIGGTGAGATLTVTSVNAFGEVTGVSVNAGSSFTSAPANPVSVTNHGSATDLTPDTTGTETFNLTITPAGTVTAASPVLPSPYGAGDTIGFTVTAEDAYGNPEYQYTNENGPQSYQGTVYLGTLVTDPYVQFATDSTTTGSPPSFGANALTSYPFASTDNGVQTFYAIFGTEATNQAVTVSGTSAAGLLNGTIDTTAGSTAVTGTGTNFTTQLTVGSKIFENGTLIGTVASITDDYDLTLAANAAVDSTDSTYYAVNLTAPTTPTFSVVAGAVAGFSISSSPVLPSSPATVSGPFSITVQAVDAYGNVTSDVPASTTVTLTLIPLSGTSNDTFLYPAYPGDVSTDGGGDSTLTATVGSNGSYTFSGLSIYTLGGSFILSGDDSISMSVAAAPGFTNLTASPGFAVAGSPAAMVFPSWGTTEAGTITTSTASLTVTGLGTAFTTQVKAGSQLYATDGTLIGTVASVQSDTSLTLQAEAYATVPNAADVNGNFSALATVSAGRPMGQVVVQLVDGQGNYASLAQITVTLTITDINNPANTVTYTAITNGNGGAFFESSTGNAITPPAPGTYTITATASGLGLPPSGITLETTNPVTGQPVVAPEFVVTVYNPRG